MKISVIIPTYNRKEYLRRLLTFLRYDNNIYEIIVVDDHSTDGTKKIMNNDYPKIRYIEGKGIGQQVAQLDGVNASKGDIIYCFPRR